MSSCADLKRNRVNLIRPKQLISLKLLKMVLCSSCDDVSSKSNIENYRASSLAVRIVLAKSLPLLEFAGQYLETEDKQSGLYFSVQTWRYAIVSVITLPSEVWLKQLYYNRLFRIDVRSFNLYSIILQWQVTFVQSKKLLDKEA